MRLNASAISDLLTRGLCGHGRGDLVLEQLLDGEDAPGTRALADRPPVPAAVLVPLVDRPDGLTVLLTQRTDHLHHHPGQISFPGGRVEEDDGDAVACALRETTEEIGLTAAAVAVLGRLDEYVTGTGFVITPIVGLIRPPFALAADPFEVADVFEVPLGFLLDRANHQLHRRHLGGRARPFWQMVWDERVIWGATAGILVNLAEVLAPCAERDPCG